MRSFLDRDKITRDGDWRDRVDAYMNKQTLEIQALRIEIDYLSKELKNIRIEVKDAIDKCLKTKKLQDQQI